MYKKFGELISNIIATDQSHYVEQQTDGSYHKKAGIVNSELINQELLTEGSIAIYQKNNDLTIRWICFDFDILKKCLDAGLRNTGKKELDKIVMLFCQELNDLNIPFLLEFSGNRGFHVWITFDESINYHTGYDIQQAILSKIRLEFDDNLIGIDLFPQSATPTGGVGKGVKIPLSKHKKSSFYSYLLPDIGSIKSVHNYRSLSASLLAENISILEKHVSTNRSELEMNLGVFFESYLTDIVHYNRIKNIKVNNKRFSMAELLTLWKQSDPLRKLALQIEDKANLSHAQRKLIVGLLCNLVCKGTPTLSDDILHEIFCELDNYDYKITSRAIQSLRSFNFPTQEQIENALLCKFDETLNIEELIRKCIPNFKEFTDANFEFSNRDIEITRAAELNYLFMNDEVQAKIVIEELSSKDNSEFLLSIEQFINGDKNWEFYKHFRNEKNKIRELITLKSNSRVATSCILKQIAYYFDLKADDYSHGYQVNKGFSGGYIFKPWLYLWLKFISNITEAIENKAHKDYYIVKTDIKNFYDNIPHDNLKRLLLGDGDSPIKDKILSMREDTSERYKKCLDALFHLTEDIVGDKKGLPQGPAYARFFAELYLAETDKDFKSKIVNGEVLFYQRYVDDIFFICKTKSNAETLLSEFKSHFQLLNLDINNEKTVVSSISGFHGDFNKYRAQSKYSVDQVSKTFVTSSDKQKDMAISEFVSLIQSDSCQDDLSFIFSHLDGVKELDELKTEQVLPALKSAIGRGSLFKNLFNFIFELNTGWEVIYEIDKYDILQSEILTSCLINALEVNKDKRDELILVFETIEPSLSYSDIVSEHVAHLITNFGCQIDVKKVDSNYYLSAITSVSNCKNIHVTPELLSHLNLSINELKSITVFTKVLYAFCYNDNNCEDELNTLSSLFYSKMSVEDRKATFTSSTDNGIFDPITANKFYYLLCIFSTSNKNISTDLIESMWKYCVKSFNSLEHLNVKFSPPNWLEKIKLVDINNSIANWIISSIVDGNIFRGLSDHKEIFQRYHNTLLVFLSINTSYWKNSEIASQLEELKAKSMFYNWLIDNEGVSIFPKSNKKWFERNIIENGVTTLKKGNEVLLRKPRSEFICQSEELQGDNGFAELIVKHDNKDLISFRQYIGNIALKDQFTTLLNLIENFDSEQTSPSIFCPDRVINTGNLSIFSSDFCFHSKIISDDSSGNITSHENSKDNFINCFLLYISEGDNVARNLLEQYFNNLNDKIDKHKFIIKFDSQIKSEEFQDDIFYYDVAISTALYLYYIDLEPLQRIDSFMLQHFKFYNDDENKHIFSVEKDMKIDDSTPCAIFSSIKLSLGMITNKVIKSLPFYLCDDIESYQNIVTNLIFSSALGSSKVLLSDFKLSDVIPSFSSRTIKINGLNFSFADVKIINPILNEISTFELRHLTLISASDHIYTFNLNNTAYLFAANSFISIMYSIIQNRYSLIINEKKMDYSYPITKSSQADITSLNGFDDAKIVIQHHRGKSNSEAGAILINWLTRLPKKSQQPLITLIQAHECMKEKELDAFIDKVKQLDKSDESLFLIKNVDDFNGTHRILYRDNEIGRDVSTFTPIALKKGCKEVTLVADLILTGYQIREALKYYINGGEFNTRSNHFKCTDTQHVELYEIFKNIDVLNICTVLYTSDAIEKTQIALREMLDNKIEIKVINGRDISGNAFFGSTTKMSENDKKDIKVLLSDSNILSDLYDHLSFQGSFTKYETVSEIDKINLVARFKSLPKKSFDFLRCGLKIDTHCKPFNLVSELSNKSKN
jgi:hypothetical protein